MKTDNNLLLLASKYQTLEQFKDNILFHGTNAFFDDELRGGGYDNVVWTARTPDVAQNYINNSGASTYCYYYENERTSPLNMSTIEDYTVDIAEKLGYEIKLDKDEFNRLLGYEVKKDGKSSGAPSRGEIWDYFSSELGYSFREGQPTKIKLQFRKDQNSCVLPEDYKSPGNLYIIEGAKDLNLYDISSGESDLQELQYHKIELFQKLNEKGFDGVIIDDFAQSENMGNFGHKSVGLFPSALDKIKSLSIPAVNFDWETYKDRKADKTPEFSFEEIFKESRGYKEIKPIVLPSPFSSNIQKKSVGINI